MNKTSFVQSGKIKYEKGKTTCSYKIGDYITSKNGKLEIKSSKDRLIKIAKKEIEKWQEFIKNIKNE